jgi:hypothetical protein
MSAVVSYPLRPALKMLNAPYSFGKRPMFIKLKAMLVESLDTEDEKLAEATRREIGYTDLLININHINYAFRSTPKETVLYLNDDTTIVTYETIAQIHEKINRAFALPLLS